MSIFSLFGVYVAMLRNPNGGGWYASEKTREGAMARVFEIASADGFAPFAR